MKKANVELETVIEKVTSLLKHQVAKKNLALSVRLDPHIPKEIYIDPERFSQVLLILLENSLKYTSIGKIEIVGIHTGYGQIRISVTDTGCGIPPDRLAHIKNRLPLLTISGITRIGLELSNILSKAFGDQILEITSETNKGTCISFCVDLGVPSHQILQSSSSELSSCTSEKLPIVYIPSFRQTAGWVKVLVVDDSEFNRMALSMTLRSNSINYYEAINGQEAVEIIHRYDSAGVPISVVFMDIDMPVMNGWKATKTICRMFQEKRISSPPKIIGYSALSGSEDVKKCYESGMIRYLPKPSPAAEIIRTLRSFITF